MRKQIIAVILICLTLFLSGCGSVETFDFAYPKLITIEKNVVVNSMCYDQGSSPQQYELLVINDSEQIKTIVDHINKIDYQKSDTDYEFCMNEYVIKLDGKKLIVNINNYVNDIYKIKSGDFDFLDDLSYVEISEQD